MFGRKALYSVLDAGCVAHVAAVRDGLPIVLPMAYARDGDYLLLHGSTAAGLLADGDAAELAVAVTLLDGLVFARSLFDSSMNYRSAVVLGKAVAVAAHEKESALRVLSEHLMPGRWHEVRPPSKRELAATSVLRLALQQSSVKVRTGGAHPPPSTAAPDSNTTWSGVLPLALAAGEPEPDAGRPHRTIPSSVRRAALLLASRGVSHPDNRCGVTR